MKSKKIYKALFLGLITTVFSSSVKSQTCNMYYPMVNGSEYEMINYDDKGIIDGKTICKITNVVTSSEGDMASVQTITQDKKDVVTGTTGFAIKCLNNQTFIEMKSFIPSQYMEQWKDMNIKSDATWLEIPQIIGIGQTLKDGSGTISVYNNAALFTTMKISVTNRNVAGKESITTTAGTFDCFKITQDIKMEITTMGITIPVNAKSAEYFSAGIGLVKSISYDKDGKLIGYSALTKITKP